MDRAFLLGKQIITLVIYFTKLWITLNNDYMATAFVLECSWIET